MAKAAKAKTGPTAESRFVQFWLDQLDGYHQEFKPWEKRAERIVKRYRDERQERSDGTPDVNSKFNALWSNVQTLSPAIYKKAPQPVIERRYLDKDPIARFASMTLERSLEVTIEECYFHPSTQKAVLDYLLVGRGVVWNRYEPTYGTPEDLGPTATDDEGQRAPGDDRSAQEDDSEEGEPQEPVRPVTWEKVYQDYVGWRNFRHTPAPVWEEVWWVAKRNFMTRRELRTRWPNAKDPVSGRLIADLVPLQDQSFKDIYDGNKEKLKKSAKTAEIWEIWDKTNKEVVFIAPEYPNAPLERAPDPLGLQEFFPCSKPLYATVTNDTLVPVPDYVEYQDQAEELDNLTARIKALTDAVRVNGVYDASFPELKRILQEGADNRLIAVAKWSELAQKGGLEGSISFIPLKDVVDALLRLYEARDKVKADMAEITGLSDIVRGQAQGAAKTATEQRIKGQFATLRLQDRQAEVARFCRDTLAIAAEVISEQFSPEILAEMTGMKAFIAEELKNEPSVAQAPSPMMGHNGGPPMQDQPPESPAQPGAPASPQGVPGPNPQMLAQQQQAMQQAQEQRIAQLTDQIFQQAVELLKNDKMRTFRIDIETDSTVEIDKQAEKEAVVEMLTAMGGFLEKAMMIGQGLPEMVPALGQSLLFAFRRFGVGRDVEGAWEQAIDKLSQKAKNPGPKPPSPEQIKAEAEKQKQQMESQRAQEEAQREREQAAMDMQSEQQKQAMEMQKMQAELQMQREEMALMREKMMLEIEGEREKAAIQSEAAQRDAAIAADSSNRQIEADERKHQLGLEVMEAKANQAKKPKVKEPA